MNLIIGMLLGIAAQLLTFLQLQGRWKFEWAKENQLVMLLLGIPISYLFMESVQHMVTHFEGQLWPSRLIGFAVGTIIFTFMSMLWFDEPITTKTAVCLGLSVCILLVQLFWK
jgi:multidrug transporter EmrE-like cation transporter